MKKLFYVASLSILICLCACNKAQVPSLPDQDISSISELLEMETSNEPLGDVSESQPVSSSSATAEIEENEELMDVSSLESVEGQVIELPAHAVTSNAELPDSITLTHTSAIKNFGEEIIRDEERLEIVCKIINESKPMEDTEFKVRSGGTIITAVIIQKNIERSLTILLGIPESLGVEVMVIRNGSECSYTDVSYYQKLIDMIE